MLDAPLGVGAQPIVGVVPVDVAVDLVRLPAGEVVTQRLLRLGRALAALHLRVAAGDQRLGLVVQRAQQLALPAVPHAGAHGANVGDGQQQQQLQPLRALHHVGEVADGLGIGQIAALSDVAHRQVLLDQPDDGFGLRRRQPEARAQLARDARADDRVVLGVALADVVQEGGDKQRAPVLDGADDLGRQRQLVGWRRRARCR